MALNETDGNQCNLWKPEDPSGKAFSMLLINSFWFKSEQESQNRRFRSPPSTKLLVKVLNGAHFLKKCIFLFELQDDVSERHTVEAHRCREGFARVWLLSRDVWGDNQFQCWGFTGSLLLAFGKLTKTTSDISPTATLAGVVPSPKA